jgi:hypothetical protein
MQKNASEFFYHGIIFHPSHMFSVCSDKQLLWLPVKFWHQELFAQHGSYLYYREVVVATIYLSLHLFGLYTAFIFISIYDYCAYWLLIPGITQKIEQVNGLQPEKSHPSYLPRTSVRGF